MATYFITGKLGAGKSLVSVGKIRDYLEQGRPVATNLDIWPDKLLNPRNRSARITRVPDRPRREDLDALPSPFGEDGRHYDEERTGLLVLDECATWLNARDWNDKSRFALLDWFLHARKHGWDLMFLVQDVNSVDKQLRKSLCEHLVVCRRLDRIPIPFISPVHKLFFGKPLFFPKMHSGKVFYGDNEQALHIDRWWYKGKGLHAAYNTRQVFTEQRELNETTGELVDMRASYCYLTPWHLVGRYLPAPPSPLDYVIKLLCLPMVLLVFLLKTYGPTPPKKPTRRFDPNKTQKIDPALIHRFAREQLEKQPS